MGLGFQQPCFHTLSLRCVPVGGTYDDTTLHGGPGGLGVDACPSAYNYLGKHCYLDAVDNAIFPDAKKSCGRADSVYFPKDRVQG